ncbi:uncharacterized protein [Drosophila bipectinata]|uniref:uncharacterized protein n=1 Tax=Drosophila bipectinata TaxID=42026 RepID=UPI001C89C73D|nr:uncharacterized protein LOC108127237 [Drosophila bipectinata]
MERLNEDVWINILKYLPMKDQLSVASINANMKSYVQYHWRHLKYVHLTHDVLEIFESNTSAMRDSVKYWADSVQSVKVTKGKMDILEEMTNFDFPHVQKLDCEMEYNLEYGDDETMMLTVLFPNLTHLTLSSSTTGLHLWRWKQLKELNLVWCEYLDTFTFEDTFKKLKLTKLTMLYYGYNVTLDSVVTDITYCTTLEELIMDDHHLLGEFLAKLVRLPNFRRLAFYTRDYYETLLNNLAKLAPLKVQSLLFHDAFWSSEHVTYAIEKMSNLRRLVFQDDDIETHLLHNICRKLKNLEELHLLKMRDLPTPDQLWNMVGSCPSLKILNLSSTKLCQQFIGPSTSVMTRVLINRTIPITLHLYGTGLDPKKVLPAMQHTNLNISFEPIKLDVWTSRFIEVGFDQKM